MKIQGKTYFLLVITAIILVMLISSLFLSAPAAQMPLVVGGATMVLVVVELTGQLRESRKLAKDEKVKTSDGSKLRSYLNAGMWLGSVFVVLYLFGFMIAIPAFIFAFMKTHKSGWFASIAFAAITTVAMYVIFTIVMEVEFWPGYIMELFS